MKSTIEIFAENLRECRRARGMTQKELAQKLGYSEKAVSKWESGAGMPPSVMLPVLAKALETSIDVLMAENGKQRYYLGIDGGGTKTEFLLADESGRILCRTLLGGSNPSDVGMERTHALLEEGIRKTCGEIPLHQVSVFAGLAGGTTGDKKKQIADFLEQFRFANFDNGNDAQNALAAALDTADGVAVILGTGSIALARKEGELTRFGGYGHLLGDGGSGYAIGRHVIRAAIAHEDGTGEATLLTDMVRKLCGSDTVLEYLAQFYVGGKRSIAMCAPLAFAAAEQGDPIAERIVSDAVKEIVILIRGGCRRFVDSSELPPIALCGGIATHYEKILLKRIRAVLGKDPIADKLFVCQRSMAEGALILAKKIGSEEK